MNAAMRTLFTAAVLGAMSGAPAAAQTQTQLADQHVIGWRRICSYEDIRPAPIGLRERRTYSLEVGRSEPCPFHYSAPPPPRRPARPGAQQAPTRPGQLPPQD